jgi:hypothetical protein
MHLCILFGHKVSFFPAKSKQGKKTKDISSLGKGDLGAAGIRPTKSY